jgi:hypothetical protein
MEQPKANRFGWGSLLAAFFGGAFFGQVVTNDEPGKAYSSAASISGQSPANVQSFASLPTSEPEPQTIPAQEEEPEQIIAPQPFMDEPAEPERDVYYANCSAARAAGAAPVYSDEPGYSGRLDRDGDGVGCE